MMALPESIVVLLNMALPKRSLWLSNIPITYQVGKPIKMATKYFLKRLPLFRSMKKFPFTTSEAFAVANMPDSATLTRSNNKQIPSTPPIL